LSTRFARTGREADLEEAIRVFQQAVKATPPDSPGMPGYLNNLGAVLSDRFERTGREADLEEAIRVSQQAVKGTPPDSPDLPSSLNNLGGCLSTRFARTGREADLEEAIRVHQQAVKATPPDSPDLPARLNNLGIGLRERFARTGREADLEEAILVYRRACKLGALSAPQAVLASARSWGRWAVQRKQWGETAEAYGYGLSTGRQLLARQLEREHKESWLRDLQEMSGSAAFALAKLAHYEDAAATMERGRARLLAEALQRRRRDLEQLAARGHEELYRRYREIVERQEQLTQPTAARPDQPDSLALLLSRHQQLGIPPGERPAHGG
jgi:TPR repeat protein